VIKWKNHFLFESETFAHERKTISFPMEPDKFSNKKILFESETFCTGKENYFGSFPFALPDNFFKQNFPLKMMERKNKKIVFLSHYRQFFFKQKLFL